MSLTSYQTAPPRALERAIISGLARNANRIFAPDKTLAALLIRGQIYARSREKIPA
jgi:hypothetical protein